MYMPKLYQEDDRATLHGLMRDYSFATLVTQHDGVPFATHLPLVLEADEGPYGTLYGHIAGPIRSGRISMRRRRCW